MSDDDRLEQIEKLWIQEIHNTVTALINIPDGQVEDFIFESWSAAILKAYSPIDPNFEKNWRSISRATKENAMLPGQFKDKSFAFFRQTVMESIVAIIGLSPRPSRGKA